jgi:cytochrome c553
MERKRRAILGCGGLLIVMIVVLAVPLALIVRNGISTRTPPTYSEELIARSLRRMAIPAAMRQAANPVELTPEVLHEAMIHWADHCASCHGNDGRGETSMGRNLYPRAPDMSAPKTQNLSDGELFAIIVNGIRLTGMPAWGDDSPESQRSSWELVHFIRHLPRITEEELEEMTRYNPVSRAEVERQLEEEAFLRGERDEPPPPAHDHGHHH